MNVRDFAAALAESLCERGVTREEALRHTVTLTKTLDREDIAEIDQYKTAEDFAVLSDSLSRMIIAKRSAADEKKGDALTKTKILDAVQGGTETPDAAKTRTVTVDPSAADERVGKTETDSVEDSASDIQEIYLEEGAPIREKVKLTPRGRGFFAAFAVLTSPLWICLSAPVLVLFGLGIAAVGVAVAVCLCLVCAEAAGGAVITLTGVIYGIVCAVGGSVGTGIFEAGLGIAAGGVSMTLGILTYNFSVVCLPLFLRHLISFEGYCLRRVGPMLDIIRRECNRL